MATEIVSNRQKTYGHPAVVYGMWADLLKPVFGFRPSVQQCSMALLLLKVAREIAGEYPPDYRDNVDDMAGFANVLAMVKEAIQTGGVIDLPTRAQEMGESQLSPSTTVGATVGSDGGGG